MHTALAMGSWLLLWVDCGLRTQDTSAALIAQVVRAGSTASSVPQRWKVYTAALLQVAGVVYRPRRREKVGRRPEPRLVAPHALCSAQAVKVRNKTGHVVEVSRWVVYGGLRRFSKQLRLRQRGETIQTAFMERWMAPCGGWLRPCGVARGVYPGAVLGTGGRSCSWSASTTL